MPTFFFRRNIMGIKNVFGNGCSFIVDKNGQKFDEDGFKTPSGSWFLGKWGSLCVSVKISDDCVRVRNTGDKEKATAVFSHEEWKVFVAGVKNGEFEV